MLHPLYEPRGGAERDHRERARMQASIGGCLICPQARVGRVQHLHQPLVQLQILPALHDGLAAIRYSHEYHVQSAVTEGEVLPG